MTLLGGRGILVDEFFSPVSMDDVDGAKVPFSFSTWGRTKKSDNKEPPQTEPEATQKVWIHPIMLSGNSFARTYLHFKTCLSDLGKCSRDKESGAHIQLRRQLEGRPPVAALLF